MRFIHALLMPKTLLLKSRCWLTSQPLSSVIPRVRQAVPPIQSTGIVGSTRVLDEHEYGNAKKIPMKARKGERKKERHCKEDFESAVDRKEEGGTFASSLSVDR